MIKRKMYKEEYFLAKLAFQLIQPKILKKMHVECGVFGIVFT